MESMIRSMVMKLGLKHMTVKVVRSNGEYNGCVRVVSNIWEDA